jgi:hypothetical protein
VHLAVAEVVARVDELPITETSPGAPTCSVPSFGLRLIARAGFTAEADRALRSSAVTQRFAADDAAAGGGSPDAFAAFIRKEQERWRDVVERASIAIE